MQTIFLGIGTPFILFLLWLNFAASAQEAEWETLFDGSSFDNFTQLNGSAEYRIEKGAMVGISKRKTPNSFMGTKKLYTDFILEFEVKVDNGLNSGVQFRSNSFPNFKSGRVHGYQCEIETSSRKWAGGIYDLSLIHI